MLPMLEKRTTIQTNQTIQKKPTKMEKKKEQNQQQYKEINIPPQAWAGIGTTIISLWIFKTPIKYAILIGILTTTAIYLLQKQLQKKRNI